MDPIADYLNAISDRNLPRAVATFSQDIELMDPFQGLVSGFTAVSKATEALIGHPFFSLNLGPRIDLANTVSSQSFTLSLSKDPSKSITHIRGQDVFEIEDGKIARILAFVKLETIEAASCYVLGSFARTEKPWGYENLIAHTSDYAFKEILLRAGTRCSLQSHNVKRETLFIAKGTLLLETGPISGQRLNQDRLVAGQAYTLPNQVIHRVTAEEDVLIYEVSTPELDDVVRHQDDYGRSSDSEG